MHHYTNELIGQSREELEQVEIQPNEQQSYEKFLVGTFRDARGIAFVYYKRKKKKQSQESSIEHY